MAAPRNAMTGRFGRADESELQDANYDQDNDFGRVPVAPAEHDTEGFPTEYLDGAEQSWQSVPPDRFPKPGDHVWYRHWSWEWLPALVVAGVRAEDNDGQEFRYITPATGTLHLRVTLNPHRHFSAGTFGYRRNVKEGVVDGAWQREAPAGWREQMREHDQYLALQRQIRLDVMREQTEETPEERARKLQTQMDEEARQRAIYEARGTARY